MRRVLEVAVHNLKCNCKPSRVSFEVIHPDDLLRFKEFGVILSMQTSHAPFSMSESDGAVLAANAGRALCMGDIINVDGTQI